MSQETPSKIKYPSIAAELTAMAKQDQEDLRADGGVKESQQSFDNRTAQLKQIIEEIGGWPTVSKVGEEASRDAWLIAQHAGLTVISKEDQALINIENPWTMLQGTPELAFMKYCLELMSAADKTEVDQASIKFLEDRIRLAEGKKQILGTQSAKGILLPIEDENKAEELRREFDMETLAEARQEAAQRYKDYLERTSKTK